MATIGQTVYYKTPGGGVNEYQAQPYVGNTPSGYSEITKEQYLQGVQSKLDEANSFLQNYTKRGNSYYNNQTGKQNIGQNYNQDIINSLQNKLSQVQSDANLNTQGYVADPITGKLTTQSALDAQKESIAGVENGTMQEIAPGAYVPTGSPATTNPLGVQNASQPIQDPTMQNFVNQMANMPAPTNTGTQGTPASNPSIVDYLNSIGQGSSYAQREALAAQQGIQNYTGTAEQNTQMLNTLRNAGTTPTPSASTTPTTGGTSTNLTDQLGSVSGSTTPTQDNTSTPIQDPIMQNFVNQMVNAPDTYTPTTPPSTSTPITEPPTSTPLTQFQGQTNAITPPPTSTPMTAPPTATPLAPLSNIGAPSGTPPPTGTTSTPSTSGGTNEPGTMAPSTGAPTASPVTPFQAPTPTSTAPNPLEAQYQALLASSPEEIAAQKAIQDQQNAFRTGSQNVAEQPIAMNFISGQQADLEKRNVNLQIPLQQQLANAQQKRQASLDAVKFGLDRADREVARQDIKDAQAFSQWATTQGINQGAQGQAFDQWATQKQLSAQDKSQAFSEWATTQGLNQQQNAQQFNQWATQQGLTQDQNAQAFSQWLGNQSMQLQANGQNFDKWLATQKLTMDSQQQSRANDFQQIAIDLQRQGMNLDEAYRQAALAETKRNNTLDSQRATTTTATATNLKADINRGISTIPPGTPDEEIQQYIRSLGGNPSDYGY